MSRIGSVNRFSTTSLLPFWLTLSTRRLSGGGLFLAKLMHAVYL